MDGFEAGSSELIFRGPLQSTVEEYKIYFSDERKSERRCGFLYTWTPAQSGTVCVDVYMEFGCDTFSDGIRIRAKLILLLLS